MTSQQFSFLCCSGRPLPRTYCTTTQIDQSAESSARTRTEEHKQCCHLGQSR